MATVTRKGQVTLPKAVRTALGLQAGSQVTFTIQEDRVFLEKVPPTDAIRRWRGYLKTEGGPSTDDMLAELRGDVDEDRR